MTFPPFVPRITDLKGDPPATLRDIVTELQTLTSALASVISLQTDTFSLLNDALYGRIAGNPARSVGASLASLVGYPEWAAYNGGENLNSHHDLWVVLNAVLGSMYNSEGRGLGFSSAGTEQTAADILASVESTRPFILAIASYLFANGSSVAELVALLGNAVGTRTSGTPAPINQMIEQLLLCCQDGLPNPGETIQDYPDTGCSQEFAELGGPYRVVDWVLVSTVQPGYDIYRAIWNVGADPLIEAYQDTVTNEYTLLTFDASNQRLNQPICWVWAFFPETQETSRYGSLWQRRIYNTRDPIGGTNTQLAAPYDIGSYFTAMLPPGVDGNYYYAFEAWVSTGTGKPSNNVWIALDASPE